MRCPKCHYISYDSQERCRNCGYEFSLVVAVEPIDLPIQTGNEPSGPLADLSLHAIDQAMSATAAAAATDDLRVALTDLPDAPAPTLTPSALNVSQIDVGGKPARGRLRPASLPFADKPVAPRSPLAVRRPTPAPVTLGRRPAAPVFEEPELDLDLPEPPHQAPPTDPVSARRHAAPPAEPAHTPQVVAQSGPRLAAAGIDALLLGGIDVGVVYLTLRVCGLTFSHITLLPPAPLISFLLLLAGGYVIAFTAAGGQTIGKMAFGIKVVPASRYPPWDDRVPLGVAILRAGACLVSLVPLGLGFVPALLAPEHRALHDRFADTRVIKA